MSFDTRNDPCKKPACLIQTCLKRLYSLIIENNFFLFKIFERCNSNMCDVISPVENRFQESACEEVFELMRECCRNYKDQSICCSGIDITVKKGNTPSKLK